MTAVTISFFIPEQGPDFIAAVKKVNDAFEQASGLPKTRWLH